MIKVSTITPCYRMEKYLPKFLEELPKQKNFNDIEVVLDHNEPTEQEINLVLDFQKRYPGRLKHIITNPVAPIGTSMNKCIQEASGEYLAIWNVDDLRTPDSLYIQASNMENNNIDVSHGNFVIVNSFGSTDGKLIDHTIYQGKEHTRSMILGPFFMFKKSLLQLTGYFDEQLKSGADFDLAIRLAVHGFIGCSNRILGYYLDEGKGASTNGSGLQQLERTVIELRYGIFDKIEKDLIAKAITSYDIRHIKSFGKKTYVGDFIPSYESFISINRNKE